MRTSTSFLFWFRTSFCLGILMLSFSAHALQDTLLFIRSPEKVGTIALNVLGNNLSAFTDQSSSIDVSLEINLPPNWGDSLWIIGDAITNINTPDQGWQAIHLIRAVNLKTLICDRNLLHTLDLKGLGSQLVTLTCTHNFLHPDQLPNELESSFNTYEYSPQKPLPLKHKFWLFEAINLSRYHHFHVNGIDYYSNVQLRYSDDQSLLPAEYYNYEDGALEMLKCPLNGRSVYVEFQLPADLWSGFQLDPWISSAFTVDSLPLFSTFRSSKTPGEYFSACLGIDSEIPVSYSLGTINRILVEKTNPSDAYVCFSNYIAGSANDNYRIHALNPTHLSIKQMSLTQLAFVDKLYHLNSLEVDHNDLSALDLSHLIALNRLNCAHNNLSVLVLPNNAPSSALEVIDAQSNALQNITLNNLSALDTLRLDHNRLSHIACNDASLLRYLSLAHNNLVNVHTDGSILDFSSNSHLVALDLSANQLDSLPKGLKQAPNLEFLDLSANRIALDKLPVPNQWTHYEYAPQAPWPIKTYYSSTDIIDLSRFNEIASANGTQTKSTFVVKTKQGLSLQAGTDYQVNQGRITFLSPQDDSCFIEIHNSVFPQLTGDNTFRTQCFKLFHLPNTITFSTSKTLNNSISIDISVSDLPCVVKVDWGNGVLKDYAFSETSKKDSVLTGLKQGDSIRIYAGSLRRIRLDDKQLTRLRIAQAQALEVLYANSNQLISLDLSQAPKLKVLNLSDNKIQTLDLSSSPLLDSLNVQKNKLSQLDLSQQSRLRYLFCGDNELSTLDLSHNADLVTLNCSSNKLNLLDLRSQDKLKDLYCFANPSLNQLFTDGIQSLRILNCISCSLDTLRLGSAPELEVLRCANNKIKSLDLRASSKLRLVLANNNQLRRFQIPSGVLDSVNISVNALTVRTLPIPRSGIKYYHYKQQAPLAIAERLNRSEAIDFSDLYAIEDYDGETQYTQFRWVKSTNPADSLRINIDYTASKGVFRFLKTQRDVIKCQIFSPVFPDLVAFETALLKSVFDSVSDHQSICLGQKIKPWYMSDSLKPTSAGETKIVTSKNDSSIYLFLTVHPSYTNLQMSLEACQNELPYAFANLNLEQAGVYDAPLRTSKGCDSLIRVAFSVKPCDTTRDTIYTWVNRSPIQYHQTALHFGVGDTLFTLSYVGSGGCDSSVLILVRAKEAVEPKVQIHGDTSVCENQESKIRLIFKGTAPYTFRLNEDTKDRRSLNDTMFIAELRTQSQRRFMIQLRDTVMAASSSSFLDTAKILVNQQPKIQWRIPKQVCDNEGVLELSYTVQKGKPSKAQLYFGEKGLRLGYTDSLYTLDTVLRKIRIPIDSFGAGKSIGLHAQIYDSIGCYNLPDSLTFEVRLGQVLRKKWNDMIVFDNSRRTFEDFQWYCDRYPIEGANKPYYWDPTGLNGIYHVVVQDTNLDDIETCPISARPDVVASSSPNPALIGQDIDVFHGYKAEKIEQVGVYDLGGRQVTCTVRHDLYPLRISGIRSSGVYIVNLRVKGLPQAIQVKLIVI